MAWLFASAIDCSFCFIYGLLIKRLDVFGLFNANVDIKLEEWRVPCDFTPLSLPLPCFHESQQLGTTVPRVIKRCRLACFDIPQKHLTFCLQLWLFDSLALIRSLNSFSIFSFAALSLTSALARSVCARPTIALTDISRFGRPDVRLKPNMSIFGGTPVVVWELALLLIRNCRKTTSTLIPLIYALR